MPSIIDYINRNTHHNKVAKMAINDFKEFVKKRERNKIKLTPSTSKLIDENIYPELKEIRKDSRLYDIKEVGKIIDKRTSTINIHLNKQNLIKDLGNDYQLGKNSKGQPKRLLTLNGVRKLTAHFKKTSYKSVSNMSIAELQNFIKGEKPIDRIKRFKEQIKNNKNINPYTRNNIIDNFENLIEPEIVNLKYYKNIIADLKEENIKLKGNREVESKNISNQIAAWANSKEMQSKVETKEIINLLIKQDEKLDELLASKKDTNK